MMNLYLLRGVVAGMLLTLPAGLKAEDGSVPDRPAQEDSQRRPAEGGGGDATEKAKTQRERAEATAKRIDHFLENHPRLKGRWQRMSPEKREYLRKRVLERIKECRDNPKKREALRERVKRRMRERGENACPEDKRPCEDRGDHREDKGDHREDFRDWEHGPKPPRK